jgi:hypothetical protein
MRPDMNETNLNELSEFLYTYFLPKHECLPKGSHRSNVTDILYPGESNQLFLDQ